MNYIQPNSSAGSVDFAFSVPQKSSGAQPSSPDISFAEALKAAHEAEHPRRGEKTAAAESSDEKTDEKIEDKDGKSGDIARAAEEKEPVPENGEEASPSAAEVASADGGDDSGDEADVSPDKERLADAPFPADDVPVEIASVATCGAESVVETSVPENDGGSDDVPVPNADGAVAADAARGGNPELVAERPVAGSDALPEVFSGEVSGNAVRNSARAEKDDSKKILDGIEVLDLRTELPSAVSESRAQRYAARSDDGALRKTSAGMQAGSVRVAKSDRKSSRDDSPVSLQVQPKRAVTNGEIRVAYNQNQQESVQLTMEMAARAGAEQNITSSSAQAAGAAGSDFQQMLSNSVQQNAADFVKAGSIVLRDNNQGTINLVLKPESLGNVKISLSLSDKTISGQILVASKEAYDAFRENIDSIKQAFAQSGFDTGSFDLSFAGQQGFSNDGGNGARENARQDAVAVANKSYGDLVSSPSDGAQDGYEQSGDHSVNIVA